MSTYKRIKDLEQLKKKAAKGSIEVFLMLNFGIRSSKDLSYNEKTDTWSIFNYIDDTLQTLKTEELANNTNIIEALEKKALYQY